MKKSTKQKSGSKLNLKASFIKDLKGAIAEVKLHKQGKLKLKTAEELLEDLHLI